MYLSNGSKLFYAKFGSDNLAIQDSSGAVNVVGSFLPQVGTWQNWVFDVDWSAGEVDVYLGNVLVASNISCGTAYGGYANGYVQITNICGTTGASKLAYVDWFMAGSDFVSTSDDLQCYSEAPIKNQGSYSLKAVALSSGSLNNTLTRTISVPVDLTDASTIYLDIRATRTGSNIKIGFHDSGGTTTEVTPNVAAVNTWQTVTLDILAVAAANKNALDSIIITVVNADLDNTFYIDNIYQIKVSI
jgi:hypothetical protein